MSASWWSSRGRVLPALVGAVALVAGVPVALPGAAPAAPVTQPAEPEQPVEAPEPPVEPPVLTWTACRDGLECSVATVPLDYDRPQGAAVDLSLVRVPATDPARRLGTLFVNPGGPGVSAVDYVADAAPAFPEELRARYDVVAFDPRGVAASTPVRCFEDEEQARATRPEQPFPLTEEQVAAQLAADRALAQACVSRAGAVIDHMATADVARDLDLLRRAVGDEALHYLGFSYGTHIGTTYANLFPDSVGAVVLDGAIDPLAWSTGRDDQGSTRPVTARLSSYRGSSAALAEFFELCDRAGPQACPFAGDAAGRFERLAERLRESPAPLGGDVFFTYQDLVNITLAGMYVPSSWPDLAVLLQIFEELAPPEDVAPQLDAVLGELGVKATAVPGEEPVEEDPYVNELEAHLAVLCSDSDNPQDPQAWVRTVEGADVAASYFGAGWTWDSSACAVWPGEDVDRYVGPWSAETAAPVLVVGTRYDPATRYAAARTLARLLPDSRLLTYGGWGHTAFLQGSACVDEAVVRYLVDGIVPEEDARCPAVASPFAPSSFRALSVRAAVPPVLPPPLERALADLR